MSNQLALTQSALAAPKDLKGVFEIEPFKNNFVQNYIKTTGQANGDMVFEREKILFMKTIRENPKLEACSRFSIYSAFIELAVSGLTLNEGLAYIIPYKEVAQFQIGWKGRLEQMSKFPEMKLIAEPQLVYESDEFDYEIKNGVPVIIKHKPFKGERIAGDKILYVYLTCDTVYGYKTWMMSRAEVISIRDRYSEGYKYYMKHGGKWPNGNPMDPPFWITDEGQAFKKTLIKRVYSGLPKTARLKALDTKIASNFDKEDGTVESETIDYGITQEWADESSNEVKIQPVKETPIEKPTERKRKTKEEVAAERAVETVDHETGEVNPVDGLGDLNEY